jgi:hypothetical protein
MVSEAPRISEALAQKLQPQIAVELGVVALVWAFVGLRQIGLDVLGGFVERDQIHPFAYLVLASAVTVLFGFVIARKIQFVRTLRARGVEVSAHVLETRYLPNLSRSIFARGRYVVRVRFQNGAEEQKAQVVCDAKPTTATLQLIYDPRRPGRVWTPRLS